MPPPGDLRRCLTALAARRSLADLYEERLPAEGSTRRCAGNLVISLMYRRLGSIQAAVDWAGNQLNSRGRVIAASETPGTMRAFDSEGRVLSGQAHIGHAAVEPVVVAVDGVGEASSVALEAIANADLMFFGPGSFFTSILAVVATPGIARACVESHARSFLIANLAPEARQTVDWSLDKHVRILKDHLTIASLGDSPELEVIANGRPDVGPSRLEDGTAVWFDELATPGAEYHDPVLLADALRRRFGFAERPGAASQSDDEESAAAMAGFRDCLALAVQRLA